MWKAVARATADYIWHLQFFLCWIGGSSGGLFSNGAGDCPQQAENWDLWNYQNSSWMVTGSGDVSFKCSESTGKLNFLGSLILLI